MKINYANNPLLGTGKWDALLSLLTPEGDSITVPADVFHHIRYRAAYFSSNGIAFFSSSTKDGVCKLWRTIIPRGKDGSQTELTQDLKAMKVGAVMEITESQRETSRNSTCNLKKNGIGEYRTYREDGKIKVVRTK